MQKELKKGIMLLKSLILHYHGLDEDERGILDKAAQTLDAREELIWADRFISEDYLSAYERAKEFFLKNIAKLSDQEKLKHLKDVWEDNYQKGYVTEMETTAIITLAKNWGVEKEFMNIIQD